MAADNEDKGYWGGYPSYLLKDGNRMDSSLYSRTEGTDDIFANYRGEQKPSDDGPYWGSQERIFNRNRAHSEETRGMVSSYGARRRIPQAGVLGKSHIVAGLLAIFLGCFGIHKFYLGYNSTGFVMLAVTVIGSIFSLGLAGMVMSVISMIEGIIYLVIGQVSFDRTYVQSKKEWF